ncbi:MAG: histidine phosphatase family protein [Duganella sp.]
MGILTDNPDDDVADIFTDTPDQKWPTRIWLVRHGQSAGNVARDAAEAARLHLIDIAERDMDVPLSELGERQAQAMSHWFRSLGPDGQPTVVLYSPYVRARQTAQAVIDKVGRDNLVAAVMDERLREKEFGILDRLTPLGIHDKFPELADQRRHVGKFYFRPPGGESWCDVILRLRSALDTIIREYRGERVLIVGHQVTVNCFRYLLERMDEETILAIDREADVPNCGITEYRFDPTLGKRGKLALVQANFVAPLEESGTPVTDQPDMPAAPKS